MEKFRELEKVNRILSQLEISMIARLRTSQTSATWRSMEPSQGATEKRITTRMVEAWSEVGLRELLSTKRLVLWPNMRKGPSCEATLSMASTTISISRSKENLRVPLSSRRRRNHELISSQDCLRQCSSSWNLGQTKTRVSLLFQYTSTSSTSITYTWLQST